MTLENFVNAVGFEVINKGGGLERELSKVFCCDLLSLVMSKNPENSVWVTVMGNVNTIAVSVLTDGGCIILAENANLDGNAMTKAAEQEVTVLRTPLPVFEAALAAHKLIEN
ncbi:MAG: DRTGG domain-containing protein [Oscillospiraceae bacterium]|nr:DRTGG domain-containing protein [Oscillospiraceae bacterium]